jgi:hypothetical protein
MANYGLLAVVAGVIAILTFGIPLFLAEYFPWRSLYNQRHGRPTVITKSYKGRTALITGANGAYGSRAAKIFAHHDIETLVLVDVKDCGGVKAEIEAELKELKKPIPKILVWQADLMTFAGCQELGKKAQELKNLDHALMTAGILAFNRRESPEGWETCKSLSLTYDYDTDQLHNSCSSQLPIQCTHRTPSTSGSQVFSIQLVTSSFDLRHELWYISVFLHHVDA